MTRAPVCAFCQYSLLKRPIRVKNRQWLRNASFISFAESPGQEQATASTGKYNARRIKTDSDEAENKRHEEERQHQEKNLFSLERLFPPKALHNGQFVGRYSRTKRENHEPIPDKTLPKTIVPDYAKPKSLSNNIEEAIAEGSLVQSEKTEIRNKDDRAPISPIEHLEELLKYDHNVDEAWRFLLEQAQANLSRLAKPSSFHDRAKVSRGPAFGNLLTMMMRRFAKIATEEESGGELGQIRPREIMEFYQSIGIWKPSFLHQAIALNLTAAFEQLSKHDMEKHKLNELAKSLSELWEVALPRAEVHTEADGTPSEETRASIAGFSQLNLQEKLPTLLREITQKFFPGIWLQQDDGPLLSFLLTFYLFASHADQIGFSKNEYESLLPFLKFSARAILESKDVTSRLPSVNKTLRMMNLTEEFAVEATGNLERLKSLASQFLAWNTPREEKSSYGHERASSERAFISHVIKSLDFAVESNNIEPLFDLWKRTVAFFTSSMDGSVNIPHAIYNSFLRTAMRLHQPVKALEIWNFMVANGVTPDKATWSAMILGSAKSKNVGTMELIWKRMLHSGGKPDAVMWTTRIQGLLNHGNIREGLHALDDMGKEYKRALASSSDPAAVEEYKPNVFTLNASMTAICRRQRPDLINMLLQWAANYDIKPNGITYNAIIHLLIAQNKHDEAKKLLTVMENSGVPPDPATMTIVLHSTIRSDSFKQMSHEQQTEEIEEILKDVEARGIRAEKHFFSAVVNTLLNEHKNIAAVRVVLTRMRRLNLRPTPQIFTILAEHYFASSPPDLVAADSLWHEAQHPSNTTDSIFCDRMIEGYASCGEVGKMMAVFIHMSKTGRRPGWSALREAVAALVHSGDRSRAVEFVSEVRRGEGLMGAGVRQRYLNKRQTLNRTDRDEVSFWRTVEELQLAT